MTKSELLLLCALILAVYRSVLAAAPPRQSKCLKAKEAACVWISRAAAGPYHDEAHMGKPCPSSPDCGCLYHGQCHDHSNRNHTMIFLCKNKKTGELCRNPGDANNNHFPLLQKKKRNPDGHVKSRQRREAAGQGKAMQQIPPVLRKIINRHRLQNPQSFGAGTFFLSGFSHINESMLLMNVVDAHQMQAEHNPPKGHTLNKLQPKEEEESSSTATPQSSSTPQNPSTSTAAPGK